MAAALENQLTLHGDGGAPIHGVHAEDSDGSAHPTPTRSQRPQSRAASAPTRPAAGKTTQAGVASSVGAGVDRLQDVLAFPHLGGLTPPPAPSATEGSLSPFTNRLNPIVVPLRVLANLSARQDTVSVEEFIGLAPAVARMVGMRLRTEDERDARRGRDKRATGWPTGQNELSSTGRFRRSFLLAVDNGIATGPLVDLGFVVVTDALVRLTQAGAEVAADKNPILDDVGDGLLSARQQDLFREALLRMKGERQELSLFLAAVHTGRGRQSYVDRKLAEAHSSWTDAQVVSHRAALIGRLRDVDVLDVSNPTPGQEVEIYLQPAGEEFVAAVG